MQLSLPSNPTLGPVGGGHIRHRFFRDFIESAFRLPGYQEESVLLSVRAQQRVTPVSFSGERLMFTQSVMDVFNFGGDEDGKTVMMDFNFAVGLLAETFVAHTLSLNSKFDPIAASLGLLGNSNLVSMAEIAYCLGMISDPKLGMATVFSKH